MDPGRTFFDFDHCICSSKDLEGSLKVVVQISFSHEGLDINKIARFQTSCLLGQTGPPLPVNGSPGEDACSCKCE